MTKLETHNGSAYSTLAQMAYDGLGNRARLVGWVSGVPYTTTYATRIVGQVQILQAGSGGITTTYWYGVSAIGEFGSSTSYYLVDGNPTPLRYGDFVAVCGSRYRPIVSRQVSLVRLPKPPLRYGTSEVFCRFLRATHPRPLSIFHPTSSFILK